jgi:hypothetical protein
VLLALPSVGSGFISDDHMLRSALEGRRIDPPPWYDLYDLLGRSVPEQVKQGALPWWTAPTVRLHLWRPLSCALLAFDHAVFGDRAYAYHLHSLAWFALLLVLARDLFRRLLTPRAATLALFVFALSPNFTFAVRWIAARHLIIAGVCVAAGLRWLVQSEEQPRRRWLAAGAFTLGLAAGEAGLGGLAFWAAREMLGPSAKTAFRARAPRIVAPVLLGVAYLVLYALMRGGARDIEVYVDPIGDPITFAKAVASRLPMLIGNALWLIEAGLGELWPAPIIAIGLLGAAAFAAAYAKTSWAAPPADRTTLQWIVPGAVLATFGAVGGLPGGRELAVAHLGFAPLIATLLLCGWQRREGERPPLWARSVVALLGAMQLVIGPLSALAAWQFVSQVEKQAAGVVNQMTHAAADARRVILLTAAGDMTVWVYALQVAREAHRDAVSDGCWWVASAAKGRHLVAQSGPRSFSVEATDSEFLRQIFEGFFRARRHPLGVGYEVEQCGATIRVAALRDGLPHRLEVRLDRPIDDPTLALLAWRDGKIERIAPSELLNGLTIAWTRGPIGGL